MSTGSVIMMLYTFIKYEAIFYIACAFIGMFTFYNSSISEGSKNVQSIVSTEVLTEWFSLNRRSVEKNDTCKTEVLIQMEEPNEEVMFINADSIKVIYVEVDSSHEGEMVVADDKEVQQWQITTHQ